jgi:hypothetical protein
MYFIDADHEKRFHLFMTYTGNRPMGEVPGLDAANYLLSALGVKDKVIRQYLFLDRIDFDGILNSSKHWSSSQKKLIALAFDLYRNHGEMTVHDIFRGVFDPYDRVALEAIRIRFQIKDLI